MEGIVLIIMMEGYDVECKIEQHSNLVFIIIQRSKGHNSRDIQVVSAFLWESDDENRKINWVS